MACPSVVGGKGAESGKANGGRGWSHVRDDMRDFNLRLALPLLFLLRAHVAEVVHLHQTVRDGNDGLRVSVTVCTEPGVTLQ